MTDRVKCNLLDMKCFVWKLLLVGNSGGMANSISNFVCLSGMLWVCVSKNGWRTYLHLRVLWFFLHYVRTRHHSLRDITSKRPCHGIEHFNMFNQHGYIMCKRHSKSIFVRGEGPSRACPGHSSIKWLIYSGRNQKLKIVDWSRFRFVQ